MPVIRLTRKAPASSDVHGVPLTTEQVTNEDGRLPWKQIQAQGFAGKLGESAMVTVNGSVRLLVGLGDGDSTDGAAWRRVGVVFARAAKRSKTASIGVTAVTNIETLAEGIMLGAYAYTEFKSEPAKAKLKTVSLVGTTSKKAEDAVSRGSAVAAAVNLSLIHI